MRSFVLAACALAPIIISLSSYGQTTSTNQFLGIVLGSESEDPAAAADLNGDGKADMVTVGSYLVPATGQNVSLEVHLSKGDGTFTTQPVTNSALAAYEPGFQSMILADVNGDGTPDVVEASFYCTSVDEYGDCLSSTGMVSVQIGKGDGTFRDPISYSNAVGVGSPAGVVAGDFNGDGKIDLAVTCEGTSGTPVIQVLLNDGSGTFTEGKTSPFSGMSSVVAAADLRRNGKADLVASTGTGVAILKNNGSGAFVLGATYNAISSTSPKIGTGDVNNDGFPDLILSATQKAYVLLGNGDATFRPAPQAKPLNWATLFESGPFGLTTGDFNRDGNLDFATGRSVYFGNGDGTFTLSKCYAPFSFDNADYPIVAADFTGDGNLDLAFRTDLEPLGVAVGNKNGIFNEPLVTQGGYGLLAVGDFNQDGIQDAVVGNTLFLGSGKDFFEAGVINSTPDLGGLTLAGDVNGDGFLDIVFGPQSFGAPAQAGVLLGRGDGTFKPVFVGGTVTDDGTDAEVNAFLADINHDGKLDLVGPWGVALGNGDGTFKTAVPLPPSMTYIQDMAIGDINGDGYPDLAVLTYDSQGPAPSPGYKLPANVLTLLLGNGDGSFRIASTSQTYAIYFGVALADISGDGKSDLVFTAQTFPDKKGASENYIIAELNNGKGGLGAATQSMISASANGYPGAAILVADFDRDGTPDLMFPAANGEMYYAHGLGGGKFALPAAYSFGFVYGGGYYNSSNSFGILDLNRDGFPDVIGSDSLRGVVRLTNRGASSRTSQ